MKHQPPPAAAPAPPAIQTASAPDATAFTPIAPDADPPTFEQLLADPEIAALMDFEPVPRRFKRQDGWTAELQRMFIARLARHGSPGKACDEMGKQRSGIDKLCKSPAAESFRGAWDAAVALSERRRAEHVAAGHASVAGLKMPFVDNRRTARSMAAAEEQEDGAQGAGLPGQLRNEHGEWEDQASLDRRAEDASASIRAKLLRCRRLFLEEISGCAGKRAAFEILTELPIDWDKAARLEPQDHEPGRIANQHKPDMILTAESGWSFGEIGYGENKMAELRRDIDQYREEEGLEPIDWGAE